MNDFASLVQIAAGIVLATGPFVLLARLIGGDDAGVTLSDVFSVSVNPPWPHRVQEEEPVRWRVERLRPRSAEPVDSARRTPRSAELPRPVAAAPLGSESGGCG